MSGVSLDGRGLARMLWESAVRPAEAARELLKQEFPRSALWMALCLVSILSVLLAAGLQALMPVAEIPEGSPADPMPVSPLVYGIMLGGSLVLTVFAFHYTGRALGGTGELTDSLMVVVWLQLLLIALQIGQSVLALALPALGLVAAILALVIGLRATVVFIREMHRFDGTGRAVLTFVLASLAMGLGIVLVVLAFGGLR